MWQFNQSTGQWEWVENPNKKQQGLEQQNIKNIVAQDIGGSSGIEDAVRDNVSRQVFEDLYPEANYDDYFEQKPFNPSDLSTSTSGQVLTGRDAEQYKLYSEKYGQSPYIGADIDDLLGESQSTADKWANGTIKFVGKTATNVIGGLAMFPGLIYGAGTGSFKNVYDNDFQRALDDANEAMDEALPNYVRKEVEDYSIIQKMSTANFWANDVLSGMSFVAGAVLTEMASAGLATPLALSRTLKGLKALQKGSKVDDALKVLGKAKNLRAADDVLGVARKGVTGTFYEAGVESRHFVNEAKEQYINNYIEENGYEPSEQEMAEAMSKIYNVANGVFAANSFLVGMGNMATLPKTFGPKLSSRLGKLFNPDKADEIAKGLVKTSDLSKTQLLRTAKKLGKTVAEVKAMNFVERSATRTALENAGRKLYKLGEKPFVEGVWEEMMQGSVNKGALDYVSSYIDDENKLELLDPILSLGRGMAETYGTQEGWEEGIIGMIIGGAGFVGPSSKGKGIGWQGGIWDSLRDPLKTQRAEYLERANSMESPKRIQAFIENGASQYRANREYNEAVQVGDMFTAKSAEHEAFFSDVNFRMKLGDYQRIEDDIAETVDDLTDLEFADMFGYENFTETEIKKRKTELKETLINRARDVKESINEARKIAKTDNEYIQDGLAYSLATIKDVDRREEELARGIADAIGAVDSRSIKNIMQANNRLRFKKGWLDVYNSKLAKLESAKKRLITMNLTGVANQGRINKQQDKINQMQNEISALEQTEFEARKKDGKGVPEYMRDFDAFKKVVEDLSGLIDKVNKHYESNPIAKKSVEGELRDLEKLAQRRETFVGEVNRLITKEGQDSFLESLNKLHEATEKGYIEEEFDRSKLSGLVDPNIDRLILQDIQKKAFESLGLRLKNAGIAIIDSSNIEEALDAEEGAIDNDGFPDDIPNFSDILTTDLAKDWVTKFMDNLPPSFDKSDPIDTKIAKTESKIKYVKEKVKELEDLIKNSKGTAIEADYKAIFDSSLLQNGLASLEQTLAKLKKRNALVPDGTPVIESASKLGQIYIDPSFVSEEDMEAVDALPKEELWKGIYIKVEDYPEQGKTVPASKSATVKVTKGIVGMSGKGAYAYININGKEVRIGGVLDPRRFIMSDGTSFNAYNLNHLAELNKAFVETIVNPDSTTDIQVSDAGMQVQNYYVAMSALFEAIEQDNGASNETINKLLYTNKSSYFTINTDDLANRPTINEEIPADKDRVTYTYGSLSKGEQTVQAQIIVRRDRDGSISIFANKDGNWVGLEGNELEAVKKLYNGALAENPKLNNMTGQYVMMLDKPSTGGNYRFLSLGFPSAQTPIDTAEGKQGLLDSIIELIEEQNSKLEEVTKDDGKTSRETKDGTGVTLKDENNNDIFLSLLTQNKNEQGKFILDKNYRVEFTVNKYGKPTVVLSTSVAGAKKIYIDLDIFVKEGKLYAKFGDKSSPITSYSDLIDRINKKIEFYSVKKYPELLSNGLPYKIGGFFNRVDSVNEEGVLENLGNLRVNATLTRNIYFSPKTKQAASNTRPSGVSAEAVATSNDAYNSFLSDIFRLDNDSLRNSEFISQLTLVINDSPVLDASQKQRLINALNTKVTQVNTSAPSSTAPTTTVSDKKADIERRRQEELKQPIKDKLQEIEKAVKTLNITVDKDGKLEQTSGEIITNIKSELDKIGLPYKEVVSNEKGSSYKVITNDGTEIEVVKLLKSGGALIKPVLSTAKFINHLIKTEPQTLRDLISNQINAKYDAELAALEGTTTTEAPSADAAIAAMGGQSSNPVAELNEVNNKIANLELDGNTNTNEYRALIAIKAGLQAQIDKSNDGLSPFSISTEDAAELIDLQVAENNLARMLNMRTPQNPNGVFSIDDVRTILSNVRNNGVTWGAFFNNVIYLSKKAGVGTEYHEAFHAVFRTLLSPTQINSYYLAARKQYGNPTAQQLAELKALSSSFSKLTRPELEKLWLEEQMAEGFKSYAVKRDAEKPKGLIGILFDKIKKLLGIVKENKSEIDLLFQDIYTGKFKNARPHNSITNFREPAFVLIPKTTTVINGEASRGYFNKQQTERIINTVASRALQKKTEKGNVTKRDILDIINELATDYYSIQNFRSELKAVKDINPDRYFQIAGKIKQLSESLSLSKTQELIADEVDKRIQIFGIKTSNEAELEDYFDDEVGERNFDQSIAEIGGFGSLSTAMRQFIAFSTEQVDEFGFGEFADLSDKKFTLSSNAFTIYTGVERVLANTAAKDMLPKLKVFAENNSSARAFFNHLTTNINMELEKKGFNNFDSKENFDILVLSQSSLFSAFASAFSKNRVPQVVVVFDPNSKQLKAYRSNIKDDSLVQITEWQRAFTNSGRDIQQKKADNVAALESLESIFNDSTLGASGPNPVPNEADLNNNITKIQQEFLKIGVSVSKGYVKHSLIQKHEKEIIAAIDNEIEGSVFLRGLMEEYSLFKDVKGLANDDIKGIKTSIAQSNNPYQKTQVVEKEAEEDTASIGRLKAIATSNSVFDETVSAVTFQNSEGKDIYTYVQPSYLTSETEKWKKRATTAVDLFEAVRENKSDKEGAEIIMSMMQMEGTPYQYYLAKNMYQTIKHNPFILGVELDPKSGNIVENDEFAIELFKNIQSYIIDGMRVASLSGEDVEGETRYFEEAFKGSFGTSYGKMDGKSKFIQALSFFSGTPDNTLRKKFRFPGAIDSQGKFISSKEREAAPIIVGVNEAKNTQNAVQLPVQNFVDRNGQINDLGVEYIIRAFLQEYYRIGNVQKEAAAIQAGELIDGHEVYDVEDYHYAIDDKDKKDYTKGKGHDFFQFKSFKNLNPDLYVELLNAAKKGTSLSQDHRAALEFLIKEKYAPDLFSKFLGKLSNTKNNLIVIQAEEVATTKVKGKTISITTGFYTKDTAPNNPNTGYVFTENSEMLGSSKNVSQTQALIRTDKKGNKNPNALPIVTKKLQKAGDDAQWKDTDADFEEFVDTNTKLIKSILDSKYEKIVFPPGFATDKAKLPKRFAEWLQTALEENFNLETDLNNTESGLLTKGLKGQKEVAGGEVKYMNKMLPSYYEYSNTKEVNMQSLGMFFFNDMINSMTYNMLVNGDYAMLFKNPTDVVKRNSRLIAAGPSLGTGVSRVAIVKSVKAKDRFDKDTVPQSDIKDLGEQDTTDAQNLGTLNWYRSKYLTSTGKLTPQVEEIYNKIEKGYRLNEAEVRILKKNNALVNPRKIVGVNRYFYDKTSIKTLLRSESSYILKQDRARADELYDRLFEARSKGQVETVRSIYEELHTLWKPIPSERGNHDLLNKLELDNIDILIFDSAIKTMKANVGSVTGNNENGFTWELSPIEVDDESFREQVKTDTIKSSIVDPTQTLNTVFSEQRSATKTSVLGKETTVGNAAQAFESLVAERSKRGFLEMRKSILSGDTPRYKYLLKMFKENLMATGADPYLIEMVSESITNADMPQFNLNMPATISKLESMFLSYLSKNTLKVKAPGHKMTLISDFGSGVNMYKGNIITAAEIQNNPEKYAKEVTTRRLAYRKDNQGNFYTEIKISAQFAEHLGLRPGDNIPSELLEMFGVRIPTQDKHSMGYFKVVDYLPMETGNQIMLPFEILKLSGADFDVDAEYLRSFDFFTLNDKPHWFGQYLKNSKPKDALEQARQEYIRENSANKEVTERITEELKNNEDYQRLKDDLSSLQKSIKLRKKFLNNLDSEIRAEFQEEIDELENILTQAFGRDDLVDDDTFTPSSDTLASLDAKEIEKAGLAALFRQITLEDDISNTIDVRKRQILKKLTALKKQTTDAKNTIREIENRNTIESLEKLGYPASEEKFDRKYGKQVLDNRVAYGKGEFEKINPITIAEINNLLIPITGSLIYNQTNEKIGNTITSVDEFDALEKKLGKASIVDNTILEGVHDATSKNDAAVSNDTGKENIGPAAVFNLMFQRLHKYGISFNQEYIENNEQFVKELANSFSLQVANDGSILNSQGVRVNELIDQVISAMTDNGKDPKAARFNLSYQTLGATLLRLGLGEGFDLAILTQKLPIMEQVVSEIQADASDLTEIKIGKIKVIASILAKLAKLPMAEDGIAFSESNLIEAIKYGQDPSQSSLDEEEFNAIQYAAVLRMGNSIIVSDYLRNLSDIIGLARGLKPTFSENYNIRNSLKNLGLEVVLKEKGNPDNPDDYIIQHIKGVYDPSIMPMDVLPILNQDKIVKTNVVLFHMMMNDSGKFFVLETPMGQKLIQKAGVSFKNSFLGYKDNITNMRTALLSYLSMRAYRKRTNKVGLDPNNLFSSNLVDLHTKLLQNPDFANNDLLNALVPQEIKFTERNRSGLAGKTLYKLSFNTRTKNNPDYVERLIDSFKALSLSNNPEAKAFAQEAFMYLMMKDGGLFKSDTFIRQIAPVFLGNISEGLNSVQELFSGNSNLSYEGVFGVSQAQLIQEFVELFARYTPNNFSLRGGKLSAILSTNYIAEDIRNLKESLKNSQQYTDQEIKDILINRFPIYKDPTTGNITLNIYRGIDENTPTDERNKIMGINAYVLKKTGLVSKNEEDKIVYPPFFQVTDQGGAKILYKLKYLQKGTFIKQDKNTGAIIPDTKYTLDADTQNLYAEEMIGLGAVYEEVSPILDKAIVPWFWKLNELDTFIEFSKLQQPEKAPVVSREAEESAPQLNAQQQAILDRLSSIGLPQTREEVAAATPVVTATPTKEESGTVSSDSLLGGMAGLRQKMKEKGVSQAVKDRVRNMGNKLKPGDTMESKSSAKQPINQAALTNILDKLALKFGISWRYDSSIPGLGQFKDGEVLINPDKAKADTPFHEFAHPFIAIVKIQNPYLYNNLMNQLTKSDVGVKTLEKVKKLHPELTYEQQIEEAIVDVIGQYAADAQSIKKEKGLWNAIKTFLRRVSEYIKSLLNDSQKKIVPSELDPNTTMQELASMLVIDNPIDLGPLLSRSYKKTTKVKPGVQELFDSNPELSNAVYEAVGFNSFMEDQKRNVRNMESDINNGWKLHLSIKGVEDFESTEDSTPSKEIEKRAKNTISILNDLKSKKLIQDYKIGNDGGQPGKNITVYIGNSVTIDKVVSELSNNELRDSKIEGNLNLSKGISARFDSHRQDLKVENDTYRLFRYGVNGIPNIKYETSGVNQYNSEEIPYSLELFESALGGYFNSSSIINDNLNKIYPNTVKNTQITPQQKQQALQLYSQYLDTIFPKSSLKKILYHIGGKNIEKFDSSMFGKGEGTNASGNGVYFQEDPYEIMNGGIGSDYFYESPTPIKSMLEDGVLTLAIVDIKKEDKYDPKLKVAQEIVIRNVEQIHVLGSKQDVEGFKEFANQSTRPQLNNVSTLFNTFANVSDADVLELINECN